MFTVRIFVNGHCPVYHKRFERTVLWAVAAEQTALAYVTENLGEYTVHALVESPGGGRYLYHFNVIADVRVERVI